MKNQIVIIEDDCYRFFSLKHVLESKFKMAIDIQGAHDYSELLQSFEQITPKPTLLDSVAGVVAILNILKKKNINRRNSCITIFVTNAEQSSILRRKLKLKSSSLSVEFAKAA